MTDWPQMPIGELQFDLPGEDQALFLAQVDELIQRFEESLVELERAPTNRALLNEIFRAAHTIKGSAATIGHTRMASLTHAMETRLDDLRKGTASVTPLLIEALLKALDVLKLLRDEVETRFAADVDVEAAASAVERRSALRAGGADLAVTSASRWAAGATHRLTIALDDGPWMAVRAFQVLLALGEQGHVVSSEPSQAQIERADAYVGNQLRVLVDSQSSESALVAALEPIPELGAIVAETLARQPREAIELRQPREVAAAPGGSFTSAKTIRIDVARLDALLNLVGELIIDRTRLVHLGTSLVNQFGDDSLLSELRQTTQHIGGITEELQQQVLKSRMLPVASVFGRLPRVVRDVAARQGKQIDLIVEGRETELDRSIVEEIGDPLLHLIRNAVDHGIETPEQRLTVGKSATGTLRLTARHAESFIVISLADDGAGVNVQAVKDKAVERGVITPQQAEHMADQQAVELIFAPGLSTAHQLSDVSGRGVGMDVVRANVEKINGSIDVQTRAGHGTTFTIRLPLTVAIVHALLVRIAGGIFALPIHSVTETLRIEPHETQRVNQHETIQLRDTLLPLVSMRQVVGLAESATETGTGAASRLVVAVQTSHARQVGLIVDGLVGEQEIVVKPLGHLVGEVAGLAGAAILGDGRVAHIVDVAALIARVVDDGDRAKPVQSVSRC